VLAQLLVNNGTPDLQVLELLRAIVRSGAVNLTIANPKGETVASILGVESPQQIESRLEFLAQIASVQDTDADPK
jgi:hypothetical protein